MKHKQGDTILIPVEITSVDESKNAPYFLSGCIGVGWWSELALDDMKKMPCADCEWKGKRHQKCTCCIRNRGMKDNYQDSQN